ncbi:uncharacterized protein BYT42DRAFT_301627 [Radiomyces spectabilis]|uniref:uncharacterized protein n=1 Tax=Radiomyces spectabilis TaxID=64574 RepID=UPI00221E8DE5|nr:uncharacterized protein BYT42DRAFT_301627 [Radiomyces spectabilis]KAI8381333.1 hypothetical protein BYT42DRAFT_301627 [Radiomyces spectabilis]
MWQVRAVKKFIVAIFFSVAALFNNQGLIELQERAITMDDFNSISESCFLVLPNSGSSSIKASSKRKRPISKNIRITRRATDSNAIEHNGFQQLFDREESVDGMLTRKRAFESTWQQTSTLIDVRSSFLKSHAIFDLCLLYFGLDHLTRHEPCRLGRN